MIRAEELMLGDWLKYGTFDTIVKVISLYGSMVNTNAATPLFPDDLEPIPITPEILEKNGFVIKKKWAQMGNFGDSPLIMWHFEDEPILRHFKHELEIHQNDTGKVHIHIPCEYVHQLQHALKLCGINKNIEL